MIDYVQEALQLTADIYDAVIDSESWPEVLRRTCAYVNGATGTVMSQDATAPKAQFYFQWGNDPEFLRSYQETYVKLNPVLVPTLLTAKAGDVLSTVDLLPLDEFFASRFYKEWVAPQGLIDSIFALLEKTSSSYAFVAFTRHERLGLVDDEARQRMKLLAPHFRRAVAIGKIIEFHKVKAASLADTLDGIAAAMFLVDSAGTVVHANASACAMADDGSVVRVKAGKLGLLDAQAERTLHEVFECANRGDAGVGSRGSVVPISAADGQRYVSHVLPLMSGARRNAGTRYSAVAAVFVRKAALDLPHPLEAIARLFDLTPAEMRVLMTVVDVGGVPEVAPILGIAETTVRTHLQRIFLKTGTTRQTELVKLVASYISPLMSKT